MNALNPMIWPASTLRDGNGVVSVGGVSVDALVAEFGSPLYVVDKEDVLARAKRIRSAFANEAVKVGTTSNIYYAGKAFLCAAMVRWMIAEGLRVDVCSGGELALALAAGADPSLIGFHGNNKSVPEIERAVRVGVGTIVLDSEIEIERVAAAAAAAGKRQKVRLRVNSGVHASTHDFLATAHEDQKFGVPLTRAFELGSRIRSHASLDLLGFHCHVGSQIFGSEAFLLSAQLLLTAHAELAAIAPLPELNLGGGFGIAYTESDTPEPIETIAAAIVDAVAAACAQLNVPIPALAFEPGRYIIGPAGVTLYEVGTVKAVPLDEGVRHYVSVDGGMSDNARPALYGAKYSAALVSRASSAEPINARIAGKHCESGDILVSEAALPGDVVPGDLIGVAATGAYCWSLASNYNFLARPAVVAVSDGHAEIIVRGESESDLLSRDATLEQNLREAEVRGSSPEGKHS